jgi:dienelactone hydrolase
LISKPAAVALVAVLLGISGLGLCLHGAGDLSRKHVVAGGVPLDEVHPASGGRHPGVVVAHGFAGSARLMAQFGDALASRGYVVVLLDFSGHGANPHPLPVGRSGTDVSDARLQHDLGVAMAHLRSLPDVDPARVALVGHSMGATAVTEYGAGHPDVTATVAISLPDGSGAMPKRLMLLVGGLEFQSFPEAAQQAARGGADRSAETVPFVEHISILFAPRTHRAVVAFLDSSFGGGSDAPIPSPLRRVSGAGLLLVAFFIGLYPLARLLFGPSSGGWPRLPLLRVAAGSVVAALVAVVVAPFLPTMKLPLAIGGFVVGLVLVTGLLMLLLTRGAASPGEARRPVRGLLAGPILIGYAAAAIAVPLQLGLTNAVPVGARWWLLPVVWAGFALFAYGAERLAAGNSVGVLLASAVVTVALTCAAIAGLTSTFVVLVVPLLAVLQIWQAAWSGLLHRFSAPSWLIALVGSLVVAWPLATALPLVS